MVLLDRMGSNPIPGAKQSLATKKGNVMEKLVRFPVTALFTTEIPEDVKYWERRGFSNPLSAKEFANLVMNSVIGKHVSKIIFAKYCRWIILGIGMKISCSEFLERYGQCYDELCMKIGAVALEAIHDFREFLMSDWIEEMNMVVFGDSMDGLYHTSVESHELSDIKHRLRKASESLKSEMLSQILAKIEEKYLALSPIYANASDIFEAMKLCDSILENSVKQIYRKKKLGHIGRKTMGRLISEIEDNVNIPRHLALKMQRTLYCRNKIEHYDMIDPSEYKLNMSDLETMLKDMLDIVEYCISEAILT